MRVDDVVSGNARRHPNQRAIKDARGSFTWAELDQRVNRLANALRTGLGLATGDRVAMLSENRNEYVEASYATSKAELVFTPLNHRLALAELETITADAEPRVLLYSAAYQEHAVALADRYGLELVALDPGSAGASYDALVARGLAAFDPPDASADDLRGICYTGGTTGLPKGVMLTHRGIMALAVNQQVNERLLPTDRHLVVFPFGLLAGHLIAPWYGYQGAVMVLLPRFDPEDVLRTIEAERITTVMLAPTMINALLQHARTGSFDVSSLRHILYGSSPISPEILLPAIERFGCDFIQVYGQTESTGFVLLLPPEDHRSDVPEAGRTRRLRTAGREMSNAWVRVVDDDDQPVPPGEPGELCVRGEQVMKGYWRKPELTAETLRGGWLHTGDIARVDDEGYFEIVDRKKDLIISGGLNIYPKEVELCLHEHPAVREVAVIGIPHNYWGEAVHAVVALKAGHRTTAEELIAFCRPRLASYKKPHSIQFLEQFPLTAAGKIAKPELRAPYWQGQRRKVH